MIWVDLKSVVILSLAAMAAILLVSMTVAWFVFNTESGGRVAVSIIEVIFRIGYEK
ncbi:hypothetical protein THOE12_70061 [Vibrio rotiferianus]|nr:hypothetical protein THOE12_70061 [Vibrio rotiferianus]